MNQKSLHYEINGIWKGKTESVEKNEECAAFLKYSVLIVVEKYI